MALNKTDNLPSELRYVQYEHALEAEYLPAIRALISKDLSEPYSIYVYRYFLCQWAHLCFMVRPFLRSHSGSSDTYLTIIP
jgi:peptide alpha-N-acetyltransferase